MSKRDDERDDLTFVVNMLYLAVACCAMLFIAIYEDDKECVDSETFVTYTMVNKVLIPQHHTNCLKYKED